MGILDALGSGMQKVGNAVQSGFSGFGQQFQPPADPNAMNAQYGVPEGDVYQQRMQSLQRMAALYMAAGQSMSGKDRAMILAQLGNNNPTTDFYNMAQARLMNTRVRDEENKRQQQKSLLAQLQNEKLPDDLFSGRERAVFDMYLKAGDLNGALDTLTQAKNSQGDLYPLQDGTMATKGVLNTNNNDFNKNYAPVLNNYDETIRMWTDMDKAIDAMGAGSLHEMRTIANKWARAAGFGGDVNQIKNAETFKALIVKPALAYMAQLGGNDSNEELKRMMAAIGEGTMEPETLHGNVRRGLKNTFESAAKLTAKQKSIWEKGSQNYNGYHEFDEANIPERYKDVYQQYFGKGSSPSDGALPEGVSEEDVEYTMKTHGLTREQVLQELGGK